MHSLLSGSPALDAGDPDIANPPAYDQRGPGFDRVFNDRIDIGAFEGQGEPAISLSVTNIDFGDVLIGADATADVTAESTGTAPLEIGTIEIVGAPAAPFAAAGGSCSIPGSLNIGESCTLGYSFSPGAEGGASQTINVGSDSLGGDDSFALQGNGTSEPKPPPPAVAIPAMGRLTALLLGGGLFLLGLLGLRGRLN